MTDLLTAAKHLDAPAASDREAAGKLDPADIWRINRLRHLITQLQHEAAELRAMGSKP